MEYIQGSEKTVGYPVKIMARGSFLVRGFTLIVPPGKRGSTAVPLFWDELIADGRLKELRDVSSVPAWTLGLGSWDPECEKGGSRYTICLEETGHTDFSPLAAKYKLYSLKIGATEWMCFEMTHQKYMERLWKDNPYKMMGPLGYRWNPGEAGRDDGVLGIHFDAYPPGFEALTRPAMEFWITVAKA